MKLLKKAKHNTALAAALLLIMSAYLHVAESRPDEQERARAFYAALCDKYHPGRHGDTGSITITNTRKNTKRC